MVMVLIDQLVSPQPYLPPPAVTNYKTVHAPPVQSGDVFLTTINQYGVGPEYYKTFGARGCSANHEGPKITLCLLRRHANTIDRRGATATKVSCVCVPRV